MRPANHLKIGSAAAQDRAHPPILIPWNDKARFMTATKATDLGASGSLERRLAAAGPKFAEVGMVQVVV